MLKEKKSNRPLNNAFRTQWALLKRFAPPASTRFWAQFLLQVWYRLLHSFQIFCRNVHEHLYLPPGHAMNKGEKNTCMFVNFDDYVFFWLVTWSCLCCFERFQTWTPVAIQWIRGSGLALLDINLKTIHNNIAAKWICLSCHWAW